MENYFDEFATPEQSEAAQGDNLPQPVDLFAEFTPEIEVEDTLEADISKGEWTSRDSLNGTRMFLQGMTSGFSDEIGLGIAAFAASLATGNNIKDIYRDMKQEYQREETEFKGENPALSTALEVGGAFASPITYMGGAPSTLRGVVARGAAEGGLYGAGTSASTDEMLEDTTKGLIGGALVGGTVGGLGWMFNKATTRKIQTALESSDGGFTPITLAANKEDSTENLLHTLYKDVVGPSFGAKGIIRAQEEKVIAPLVEKQARRKSILGQVEARSKQAISAAKREMDNSIDKVGQQTQAAKAQVKEGVSEAEQAIKGRYETLTESALSRSVKDIDDTLESANSAFRLAAFDSALPANIPKAQLRTVIDAPNPNVAMQRLDEAWNQFGFQSLKNRSFRINPKNLEASMLNKIKSDPTYELLATSKGEVTTALGNALNFVAAKTRKGGYIDGNDLSTIRNSLGTAAAAKSDAGGNQALLQSLYRDVQSTLDDIMEKQLSGKGLQQFKADRAAWKSNTILRDSVTKTSKETGKYGRFTPDDWIGSIAKNSPRDARRGLGPLREQAEGFAKQAKDANSAISSAAKKLESKLAARKLRELGKAKKDANTEIAKLEEGLARSKARLRFDASEATQIAEKQKRIQFLKQQIANSDEMMKAMNKMRVNESPSWFHSLAATGVLGGTVGLIGKGAGALVGGAGLGNFLAKPSVQKVMAGQGVTQQKIQAILDSKLLPEISAFQSMRLLPESLSAYQPQTVRQLGATIPLQFAKTAGQPVEEPQGMLTGQ